MSILQQQIADLKTRYRREQELMLSIIHNMGMKNARRHLRAPLPTEKTSFLGIQRSKVCSFFTPFFRCIKTLPYFLRTPMLFRLRWGAVAISIQLVSPSQYIVL